MSLDWTGNPFIDTGLAVMVAQAQAEGLDVSTPGDLRPDVLKRIIGNGEWLADANRRLKSYSLVLGSNSPLTQSGTNPDFMLLTKKRKVEDARLKIGEIGEAILAERNGKNREKQLLNLANQREKAVGALSEEEAKLAERLEKQSPTKNSNGSTSGDLGLHQYLIVIQALLEDVLSGVHSKVSPCECTGVLPATNALQVATQRIREKKLNSKRDAEFVVGRDWFPLAGSLGNDAQALPAASRAPQISALALLAVQFLPMGVLLLNGQLVLFQSTEPSITQAIVSDIYRETKAKLDSSSIKVETRGVKAGTTPTAQILLKQFERLRQHQRVAKLPPHTTLNLWLFSNSGNKVSASIIEVPHPALDFLWDAALDYATELEKFLCNEAKIKPDNQLLSAIQSGKDYWPFYPSKGTPPASIGLFELYQQRILEHSPAVLQTARWVAARLHAAGQEPKAPKDFKQLAKLMGDSKAISNLRPRLKGLFAEWAEHGEFSLNEYTRLFPCQQDADGRCAHPLRAQLDGWKLVWFYLNHPDALMQVARPQTQQEQTMFTHPKIKQFAADVFDVFQQRYGLEKFHQRILKGFQDGKITNIRLRTWFIDLATLGYEGYTLEAWDDLCRDDNGNDVTFEVRFQLRLELANLYARATNANPTTNKKGQVSLF